MNKSEIVYKNIDELIPYANNPRLNDDAVDAVAASIKEFGFKQPIVVDSENVIVVGHTRYKAAKKLGLETVPVIVASDLTPAQAKAYRLADNKVSEKSSWDMELLALEIEDIVMDMELFGFDNEEITSSPCDIGCSNGRLAEEFIVPPFSILDARQGYWQDRKSAWKELGIKSEIGRDAGVLSKGLQALAKAANSNSSLTGTSVFDPVLCEIVYRWFCTENGRVFDCFAGGSVRGVVAGYLGYDYIGIDLRKEQIDANIKNADEIGVSAKWFCDDSLNADKYVDDDSVDLVFSCPPYADLEVYSDDPRDLSTMEYGEFIEAYTKIIKTALRKLKQDRFAVFVVGDMRDPKGYYRGFISDTKRAFIENGAYLYNELILAENFGTVPIRARRQFNGLRKIVKCHQNILVFYKGGNLEKIRENYKEVKVADLPYVPSEGEKNDE